jgi:hypothetical protein
LSIKSGVNKRHPGGRPNKFKPEYVEQARRLCQLGLTDPELAVFFGVHLQTINNWKAKYPEFLYALKAGKEAADNRVERSLYSRAVGYNYEAVRIFMPANRSKPVYAKYIEHVPPDTTAAIFWMKNRDPAHWRDSQQLEHVLGKYIISDKPMSEAEWARERATTLPDAGDSEHPYGQRDGRVIDAEPAPRFGDGREENLSSQGRAPQREASPVLPRNLSFKPK